MYKVEPLCRQLIMTLHVYSAWAGKPSVIQPVQKWPLPEFFFSQTSKVELPELLLSSP